MQLIRLALVHGQNRTLRGQRQIRHIQPYEFTAAHGSGKSEQQHRLVARARKRRGNQLHDLLQVGGQQRALPCAGVPSSRRRRRSVLRTTHSSDGNTKPFARCFSVMAAMRRATVLIFKRCFSAA